MPNRSSTFLILAALMLCARIAAATPLGRGFTYQGQLDQSGVPVDGAVTLRFSLWDAAGSGDPPTGGTMIGAVQTVSNVLVSGGVFAVVLNGSNEFGTQAFNGEARWLQVEICADTTCAATTVLGPRQALTGAPYSLGPWQVNGTSLSYSGSAIGIGTTSPALSLHIKLPHPAMVLQDTDIPSNQTGYLSFWNSNPTETGWVGYGSIGSPQFSVVNVRPAGDIQLYTAVGPSLVVKSGGSVGIGTSAPASKLEVRGDVRLGTTGQYFAPGSTENLRIIRGKVSAAGSISFGTGFTVLRNSTGVYTLTFTTHYPSGEWPVVTASAESNGSVARFAMVNTPTHISAIIRIVNGSGSVADADFYFIAVGLR